MKRKAQQQIPHSPPIQQKPFEEKPKRLRIFNERKKCPDIFEIFSNHWHAWTPQQKIGAVIMSLIALGLGLTAAYYLAPSLIAVFEGAFGKTTSHSVAKPIANSNFFKSFNISIDPFLRKKITSHPPQYDGVMRQIKESIKTQRRIIQEVLPATMHPIVLKKVVEKPNFSITISHAAIIHCNGRSAPEEHRIEVAVNPADDRKFIEKTLANEIHGLATGLMPDATLASKLDHAIKATETNINRFIDLYIQKRADNSLLIDYQPRIRELRVHYSAWASFQNSMKPHNKAGIKFVIPQTALYSFIKAPKIPLFAYIHNIIDDPISRHKVIRYYYAKDDSLTSRIEAFIGEYFEYCWRFSSTGPYVSSGLTPHEINIEKSSDFEELRPSIPTFYDPWCDFFSTYHNVDDYCMRASFKK